MFDDFLYISFPCDSTHPWPLGISEGRYELRPKASGAKWLLTKGQVYEKLNNVLKPTGRPVT
jgi:hypothetical protein